MPRARGGTRRQLRSVASRSLISRIRPSASSPPIRETTPGTGQVVQRGERRAVLSRGLVRTRTAGPHGSGVPPRALLGADGRAARRQRPGPNSVTPAARSRSVHLVDRRRAHLCTPRISLHNNPEPGSAPPRRSRRPPPQVVRQLHHVGDLAGADVASRSRASACSCVGSSSSSRRGQLNPPGSSAGAAWPAARTVPGAGSGSCAAVPPRSVPTRTPPAPGSGAAGRGDPEHAGGGQRHSVCPGARMARTPRRRPTPDLLPRAVRRDPARYPGRSQPRRGRPRLLAPVRGSSARRRGVGRRAAVGGEPISQPRVPPAAAEPGSPQPVGPPRTVDDRPRPARVRPGSPAAASVDSSSGRSAGRRGPPAYRRVAHGSPRMRSSWLYFHPLGSGRGAGLDLPQPVATARSAIVVSRSPGRCLIMAAVAAGHGQRDASASRQRAIWVDLDQQRVGDPPGDCLLERSGLVTNRSSPTTWTSTRSPPSAPAAVPVVLGQRVRWRRAGNCPAARRRRWSSPCAALAALERVAAVGEELRGRTSSASTTSGPGPARRSTAVPIRSSAARVPGRSGANPPSSRARCSPLRLDTDFSEW